MSGGRLRLRRVERLEQIACDEHRSWLRTLTEDELEARRRELPPLDTDVDAVISTLSDAELDWLISTSTTDAELQRRLRWLERRHRARS